ncbi:hypothetical protein BJ165DRAFT_997234 [Panaeolus papilionaceus]|nr:hypothetical protein BJ165DRAFT_997234 [Panaeolus papilionaceus]
MADESMKASKSSTVQHLPQEIIESILDYNKDNIRTLRSCALVSRSFVARSQEHIFSKITLGPALGPYISIKLRDIFAESPHLALLVNTLSIMEVSTGSRNWILSSTALSAILPQMLRTGSLTLRSRGVTLSWGSLSEGLQHALITVITRGKVEHLVLTGVQNFPVRMIRTPTLTQLDLSASHLEIASLYTANPETTAHDLECCHLKSLSINGQRYNMNSLIDIVSLMMDPRSGIDISSLRHLTIRPQYKQSELANFIPDFTAVRRLLQKTKLLKEFWLDHGRNS